MMTARAFFGILLLALACVKGSEMTQDEDNKYCSSLDEDVFAPRVIRNDKLSISIVPFGATVTSLIVKDGKGIPRDILLGFDDPRDYCFLKEHPYFGATIGRVANRIKNGTFTLNDTVYYLPRNENDFCTLHGGSRGFDKQVFKVQHQSQSSITFEYSSEDGDNNFPAELYTTVTYEIDDNNEFIIRWEGINKDKSLHTLYNPTFHGYFNLGGFANGSETILEHELYLDSVLHVEVDDKLIPTGRLVNISTTPWMNFRKRGKSIGHDILSEGSPVMNGYDTAFIFPSKKNSTTVKHLGTLRSKVTEISMEIYSNFPSLQVYTGQGQNGTIKKKRSQLYKNSHQSKYYERFSGVTFEPQYLPDAINNHQWWSETHNTVLAPGTRDSKTVRYKFKTKKGKHGGDEDVQQVE